MTQKILVVSLGAVLWFMVKPVRAQQIITINNCDQQIRQVRYIDDPGQSKTNVILVTQQNNGYHRIFRGQNHFLEGVAFANDILRCKSIILHNVQNTSPTNYTYTTVNIVLK